MVHDVLGLRLNKVTVQEGGGGAGPNPNPTHPPSKKVAYDVDEKDFFWEACGSYPFPRQALKPSLFSYLISHSHTFSL